DLAKAVPAGVGAAFLNSGQTCTALTRMLVPRSKLAEVEQLAVQAAEQYTPGDPFTAGTRLGPLVSAAQRERVRGYINKGVEEGAVAIANNSIYGLAGGVWSGDQERAKKVARQIRTGMVDVNGGSFNPMAPFGGYKQSGNGREAGKFGLEEFLETKSLQL